MYRKWRWNLPFEENRAKMEEIDGILKKLLWQGNENDLVKYPHQKSRIQERIIGN